MAIADKEIKKLRFVMTDINNRVLDFCNMSEYTMIIKISVRSKVR
jgi:hypothetical protein